MKVLPEVCASERIFLCCLHGSHISPNTRNLRIFDFNRKIQKFKGDHKMSWNDGYERKKFNARIKKEIIEYKALGMTEEQIAAIVRLDEDQYRSERRYHMHTQEFCESDFDDDDGGDNGKSPLYEKYMEQLTVSIDDEKSTANRYGWLDDIGNAEMYVALSSMSEERVDLLTSVVFEGKSMTEIAKEKGLSVSAITQRMGTIKKYLRNFSGQP